MQQFDKKNLIRPAVEKWISDRHSTLVLDWDVSQKDRRDEAVEFLTDMWVEVYKNIAQIIWKALDED